MLATETKMPNFNIEKLEAEIYSEGQADGGSEENGTSKAFGIEIWLIIILILIIIVVAVLMLRKKK